MSAVDRLVAQAREGLHRLTPAEALAAQRRGALLVDTRTESQRRRQGDIPGALVVDRTVLEWRLDPSSPWHLPEVTDTGQEVVVLCRQGYSSSLAAASLQALGLHRATDVIGGYHALAGAGVLDQLSGGSIDPGPGLVANSGAPGRRWI